MTELTVVEKRKDAAVLSPLVLRETSTTRLVFRPLITNSEVDRRKPLKGTFLYQRKGKNDEWEDANTIDLSKLKSGDGVRLEIKTAEIHRLKEWIERLYKIYDRNNAPPVGGATISLVETSPPAFLYDVPDRAPADPEAEASLVTAFRRAKADGKEGVIAEAVEWLLAQGNADRFVEHIGRLKLDSIEKVNALSGVARMKAAVQRWESNRQSDDEGMWQALLREDSYVLSQVFSFPVVMFGREAYVGGKAFDRSGEKLVDFLLTTKLTNNVVIVEVKTPVTKLIGSECRKDVFKVSEDLVAAVAQGVNYKQTLLADYATNSNNARQKGLRNFYDAFEPRCIVVAGDLDQVKNSPLKRKGFDLFRNNLKSVEVITYDELFEKTRTLIRLLEGDVQDPPPPTESEDEPPF